MIPHIRLSSVALPVKQLLNAVDAGSAPCVIRGCRRGPHVTIIGPFRVGLDPVLAAFMVAVVGERRGRDVGRKNPGTDGQHHLVAGIGLWRARRDRYRRAVRFLTLGQSSCHSKRTKIAVITSRSSGTE